jgi:hypothetical protein
MLGLQRPCPMCVASMPLTRSTLRTMTLRRRGAFDAAHEGAIGRVAGADADPFRAELRRYDAMATVDAGLASWFWFSHRLRGCRPCAAARQASKPAAVSAMLCAVGPRVLHLAPHELSSQEFVTLPSVREVGS